VTSSPGTRAYPTRRGRGGICRSAKEPGHFYDKVDGKVDGKVDDKVDDKGRDKGAARLITVRNNMMMTKIMQCPLSCLFLRRRASYLESNRAVLIS